MTTAKLIAELAEKRALKAEAGESDLEGDNRGDERLLEEGDASPGDKPQREQKLGHAD